MAGKKNTDPETFWKQYEASLGEKVLAYTLGQYLAGWEEYAHPLWGLLIATDGGFRFHHFPHEGWIQALSRISTGGEGPKEKIIFIPRDRILAVELRREQSLLKRIFVNGQPRFVLRYRDNAGAEVELIAETDSKASLVVEKLQI
ncbi:hypothetical protein AGMMS49944_31260 [Spirochaetia bacterium]|nr:hypothetical protein AGMMS49944_31260 [Spirochaetia bacterium]